MFISSFKHPFYRDTTLSTLINTRFQPRLLNCPAQRERERCVCELINVLVRGKGWETSKSAEFAMHCKVYVPPKQEEVHPVFSLVEAAALLELDFSYPVRVISRKAL